MEINGSVVLITGASSGIGAATARSTSRAAAKVVLAARRDDRIRALADELDDALAVTCNVTDSQAVLPIMCRQGGGSIVNVSSGTTLGAAPGSGAYTATKYGLEKLSEIARAELADDDGISVSTIWPFLIDSEFMDSLRAGADEAAESNASREISPDSTSTVADATLALIRSGEERVDLVPARFGGSVGA